MSEFPAWLETLAVRIDELVQNPAVLERFRAMIREWCEINRREDAEAERNGIADDPFSYPTPSAAFEFKFLPRRALDLRECYVLLAQVHDIVCERDRGIVINPFHRENEKTIADWTEADAAAFKDALPHLIRRSCATPKNWTDDHRKRLVDALGRVEVDFAPPKVSVGYLPDDDPDVQDWVARTRSEQAARLQQRSDPLDRLEDCIRSFLAECEPHLHDRLKAARKLRRRTPVAEEADAVASALGKRIEDVTWDEGVGTDGKNGDLPAHGAFLWEIEQHVGGQLPSVSKAQIVGEIRSMQARGVIHPVDMQGHDLAANFKADDVSVCIWRLASENPVFKGGDDGTLASVASLPSPGARPEPTDDASGSPVSDTPIEVDPPPTPTDENSFLQASTVITNFREIASSHKVLTRILKENPQIRRRKPSPQRLQVHIGDLLTHVKQTGKEPWERIDRYAEAVEERKATARAKKARNESGK